MIIYHLYYLYPAWSQLILASIPSYINFHLLVYIQCLHISFTSLIIRIAGFYLVPLRLASMHTLISLIFLTIFNNFSHQILNLLCDNCKQNCTNFETQETVYYRNVKLFSFLFFIKIKYRIPTSPNRLQENLF